MNKANYLRQLPPLLVSSPILQKVSIKSTFFQTFLIRVHIKHFPLFAVFPHFLKDGETMETVRDFIFLGSKITADGDCSHEAKRHLLLRRKAMTNLDSILKSSDIILSTKVHLVKAMLLPVVMYGCESWTVKKAEC